MAVIVKTGCSEYTIQTGNTGDTYEVTITNVNGDITHTWSIVDNANAVIDFTIDGIYNFTTTNNNLFFNVSVPITAGGVGNATVSFTQLAQYIAPQYAGAVITINIPVGIYTFVQSYTIQNTDTSSLILAQSLSNAINAQAVAGYVASVVGGVLTIVTNATNITSTPTEVITEVYAPFLWSTCNLFKCIKRLTNKVLCAIRGKCEEHTEKMQRERDEFNRIMVLYTQFSMMNDQERWDYLGVSQNTDILNDIFDKLNCITRRCGKCCKDEDKHHHHHRESEDNLPYYSERNIRVSEEPCTNCEESYSEDRNDDCPELPTEAITITGTTVTLIS